MRYVHLPSQSVDIDLLEDATRRGMLHLARLLPDDKGADDRKKKNRGGKPSCEGEVRRLLETARGGETKKEVEKPKLLVA